MSTIEEHLEVWHDKPVVDFATDTGLTDPVGHAYRIFLGYDDAHRGETFSEAFAELLEDPRAEELTALVIGMWAEWISGEPSLIEDVVATLVGASDRLPNLKALFIGDITREECEISWIPQGDLSPVFGAFPQLEALGIRGGQGLTLGTPRHANLKKLVIEAGGLPVSVVQEITSADLPVLEHIELWLGDSGYGWDGAIEDLTPFFDSSKWPHLKYLGLRNSEITDEIAGQLATSPILKRLRTLDLSLGTLSNAGAEALLSNRDALTHLEKLDIHHHFLTQGMINRLQELGITVDVSDPQAEDEEDKGATYRYVAVSE